MWCMCIRAFNTPRCLQDSLESVEALLKKQDDFEKTLAAQEEKFQSLNRETAVRSSGSFIALCNLFTFLYRRWSEQFGCLAKPKKLANEN